MTEKPSEIRQRGPDPKILRMSKDEIRNEFARHMKFLAKYRSPKIEFENDD